MARRGEFTESKRMKILKVDQPLKQLILVVLAFVTSMPTWRNHQGAILQTVSLICTNSHLLKSIDLKFVTQLSDEVPIQNKAPFAYARSIV